MIFLFCFSCELNTYIIKTEVVGHKNKQEPVDDESLSGYQVHCFCVGIFHSFF